jgi:hypothetical protein
MQYLRRSAAEVLLVAGAMVPALAAAPAYAVGSSSAAPPAHTAGWTFVATYPDLASCQAAGPFNPYGDPDWQCWASPTLPGGYDLYVLL